MDSEKLKTQIGANIAACRKQAGMTQAELAEKINYTDKAISKWERGESVPDVITLVQLAEVFSVNLDALVGTLPREKAPPKGTATGKRAADKNVIQLLVSLLVWFVALFVYVVLSSMNVPRSWVGFIYAVPANAIVLLSLRSAWRKFNWNFVLVSLIVWGSLVSFYMTMLVFTGFNIWKLFLLGAMGQAAVILWFRMFRGPKEDHNEH